MHRGQRSTSSRRLLLLSTNLRRNELKAGPLAPCLLVNDVLHLGVELRERGVQVLVLSRHLISD